MVHVLIVHHALTQVGLPINMRIYNFMICLTWFIAGNLRHQSKESKDLNLIEV